VVPSRIGSCLLPHNEREPNALKHRHTNLSGMKTRILTSDEVDAEPFRLWNAYVDLLATESYEHLSQEQRPAHLVFWYESEVQNGGHFQYFENRGLNHLAETIEALGLLGAVCQQRVLSDAGDAWSNRSRRPLQTALQFCEAALEGEFKPFDSRFHGCLPTLQQFLEEYLRENQSSFVTIRQDEM
jgi:hypothetical protein